MCKPQCWSLLASPGLLLKCAHKTDCLSLSCFLTPQTTAVSCSISSVARQKGASDIRITDRAGRRLAYSHTCVPRSLRGERISLEPGLLGEPSNLQVLESSCIRKIPPSVSLMRAVRYLIKTDPWNLHTHALSDTLGSVCLVLAFIRIPCTNTTLQTFTATDAIG